MKIKQISIIGVAVFIITMVTNVSAQKLKVTESSETLGGGKKNALVVSTYGAELADVENKWKSLMKENKAKISITDGIFADNAVIPAINGNNTIDVFAKTQQLKEGEVKLMVAFDLGGAILNSAQHTTRFAEAKKMVYDFAVKATRESITGQRKTAEKTLEKLVGEQNDLVKENTKHASTIEDCKKKIKEYELKIKEAEGNAVKNKVEQDKKKIAIDLQKKTVEAIAAKERAVE